MDFPFLTLITFIPIIAAIILFMMPDEGKLDPVADEARIAVLRTGIRSIAAAATFISLLLAVFLYFGVNRAYAALSEGAEPISQALFFYEDGPWPWVQQFGIAYHMGIDGMTAPMVMLTGLASFCGVL